MALRSLLSVALFGSACAFQAGVSIKAPFGSRAPQPVAQATAEGLKQVPHGGKLVDLMAPASDVESIVASADVTIELTDRQSCDVQLLCNGGFSPLTGFMTQEEYDAVVENMRLPSDLIYGLPVVMDTDDAAIEIGSKVLLSYKGTNMGLLTVSSKWTPVRGSAQKSRGATRGASCARRVAVGCPRPVNTLRFASPPSRASDLCQPQRTSLGGAGQAARVPEVLRYRDDRAPGRAHGRHGAQQHVHRRTRRWPGRPHP